MTAFGLIVFPAQIFGSGAITTSGILSTVIVFVSVFVPQLFVIVSDSVNVPEPFNVMNGDCEPALPD